MALVDWRVFPEFVYNKSVALVGGAGVWDQATANKADLVVRINGRWLEQRGRIDILYYSGPLMDCVMLVELENENLQFAQFPLIHMYDSNFLRFCDRKGIPYELWGRTQYHAARDERPEYEWTNVLMRQLGTFPLQGIIALRHLTMLPVKSVFMTGFDFYMDKETGEIPELNCECHEVAPHISFVKEVVRTDSRVICDEVLRAILAR